MRGLFETQPASFTLHRASKRSAGQGRCHKGGGCLLHGHLRGIFEVSMEKPAPILVAGQHFAYPDVKGPEGVFPCS